MSKYLVEESWVLSIGALKKDIKKIREGEENISGKITLHNGNKQMQATYWSEDKNGEKYLAVTLPGTIPMEIPLQNVNLTYGLTSFFSCPGCSKRCSKLYIHPEVRKGWKCAKCHGLVYHLQSFNPYSVLGIAEYRMDQYDKLFLRRKPKMFYAGKETKPFIMSIRKMQKMGMVKNVRECVSKVEEYKDLSKRISIISDFLRKSGDTRERQSSF